MDLDDRKGLTVNEFSALWGLSRATCYRLIQQGHLRAFRFGDSRYIIPMTEVHRIEAEAGFKAQEENGPMLTREAPPQP
jgi:excisionase family DNA binding protein